VARWLRLGIRRKEKMGPRREKNVPTFRTARTLPYEQEGAAQKLSKKNNASTKRKPIRPNRRRSARRTMTAQRLQKRIRLRNIKMPIHASDRALLSPPVAIQLQRGTGKKINSQLKLMAERIVLQTRPEGPE